MTVKSGDGVMEIDVPRDREDSSEPAPVRKDRTRIEGFDDRIIAMQARGMSVREIRARLEEIYGIEVSPDPGQPRHRRRDRRGPGMALAGAGRGPRPVVIFDALRVKIRDTDSRIVRNKAVHIGLGIAAEGEVLGLWIAENESARFRLSAMNELRNRRPYRGGRRAEGFPEAIAAAFPQTTVQTCIVHLVRHSLNFPSGRTEGGGRSPARGLRRGDRRGPRGAGGVRRGMGRPPPLDRPGMATGLGGGDPLHRLRSRIRRAICTTDDIDRTLATDLAVLSCNRPRGEA